MERLQDWRITLVACIATLSAWIVRKLWGRLDTLESTVQKINADRITKQDLDKIINIQHLILQSLLSGQKNVATNNRYLTEQRSTRHKDTRDISE